jgi:hypothetical protein
MEISISYILLLADVMCYGYLALLEPIPEATVLFFSHFLHLAKYLCTPATFYAVQKSHEYGVCHLMKVVSHIYKTQIRSPFIVLIVLLPWIIALFPSFTSESVT